VILLRKLDCDAHCVQCGAQGRAVDRFQIRARQVKA